MVVAKLSLVTQPPESVRHCRFCDQVKAADQFRLKRLQCKACRKQRRDARPENVRAAERDRIRAREHERNTAKRATPQGWIRLALNNAKGRAKQAEVPFDLAAEDLFLPEFCPVLGIKLELGKGVRAENSPSLDRMIPALGYVRGNVRIISWRANRLKSDSTASELRRISDWMIAAGCE